MSRLLSDIKECEKCNCETDELYLTKFFEILCADCEADFIVEENEDDN